MSLHICIRIHKSSVKCPNLFITVFQSQEEAKDNQPSEVKANSKVSTSTIAAAGISQRGKISKQKNEKKKKKKN